MSHWLCVAAGASGSLALHGWMNHGELPAIAHVLGGAVSLLVAIVAGVFMVVEETP